MSRINIKKNVLAALFLALGMVLPLITSQIKEIGDSLLPMHLTVLLCGVICGAGYGASVGLLTPFLRSMIFGMPPLFPNAVWMALELATYGFVIGFLYSHIKKRGAVRIYVSLVTAMVAGRLVWGLTKWLLLGIGGKSFTLALFISGGFIDALPGIVIQLILIPLITNILHRERIKG